MKRYLEIDVSPLPKDKKQKLMDTYRNIHLYEMELMGIYEHYIVIEVDETVDTKQFLIMREAALTDSLIGHAGETFGDRFKIKYGSEDY